MARYTKTKDYPVNTLVLCRAIRPREQNSKETMQIDSQNRILVAVTDIVPSVFPKGWYDTAKRRGKIDVVTLDGKRAGRGRSAFVVWDTLCDKYKQQITAALGDPREILGLVPVKKSDKKVERVAFEDMTAKELALCNAKYNLCKAYRQYAEENGRESGVVTAKREFVQAVIDGYLCQESYAVVGRLSFQTLERWNKELREGGDKMDALAPVRAVKRGTSLTAEQQKVLIQEYCKENKPSIATTYRMACRIWRAQGVSSDEIPTLVTCRRFIDKWSKSNARIVTFRRNGIKDLTDNVLPSLERDPSSIKYLDCLVSDGKVLNMQVVNPNTGKLCRPTLIAWMDTRSLQILGFELMVTENTMAVASAFRHACQNAAALMGIDGAVMPRAVYMDNGRAFKNKFFRAETNLETQVGGLFERLKEYGLEQVLYSRPYNARTKIIERAWQSFNEMEGLANTYVGNSIDNKPASLKRNEKWHKQRREGDIARNGAPTLWGAYKACEWWIAEYNNMASNGKYLDGISPNEMAASQIGDINVKHRIVSGKEVDCMIMHAKTMKLNKNGFRINGTYYYNPQFADFVGCGEEFVVRYDLKNTDRILVYREDGTFWCDAGVFFGGNLHAFAALGSDADRKRVKEAQRKQAFMLKEAVKVATSLDGDSVPSALPDFSTPHEIASGTPLLPEKEKPKFRLF